MDYFLCYLDSRKDWLEAVCISGGEPLMEEGVEDLLRVVKDRKLLVKIDTNGAFPDRLEGLIKNGLVDYAAMDVKAPIERYKEVTKVDVCTGDIRRSIEILRKSGLKTLFRTTVVPGLIGAEDVKKICRLLDGTPAFQIQQFSPRTTIDKRYLLIKPYSREDIEEMARHARPHFSEVRIEGV
jgi:pyruvate formate lyase activating enzyme